MLITLPDVHTSTMTLKGAALLALVGTALVTAFSALLFVFLVPGQRE